MSKPKVSKRAVETFNRAVRESYKVLPWTHPVGAVQWIHVDKIQANDWNPNSVAGQEMRLLHTSISEDGYTQPIVAIWDKDAQPDGGRYIIIDGFHRFTAMKHYKDLYNTTGGYLPIVVIDKSPADRLASTVRHNRARGKHSVAGMGNLVFEMLVEGEDDETVCMKLGLEAEELARLKHITGYSKLYANATHSRPELSTSQIEAKREYKKAHPDESIPAI